MTATAPTSDPPKVTTIPGARLGALADPICLGGGGLECPGSGGGVCGFDEPEATECGCGILHDPEIGVSYGCNEFGGFAGSESHEDDCPVRDLAPYSTNEAVYAGIMSLETSEIEQRYEAVITESDEVVSGVLRFDGAPVAATQDEHYSIVEACTALLGEMNLHAGNAVLAARPGPAAAGPGMDL